VFSTNDTGPVIIVSSQSACDGKPAMVKQLTAAGARVLPLTADDIHAGVRTLFDLGIASLVLEGGATLHRAALEADIVDAVHLYVTPRILGTGGLPWVGERRLAWETLQARRAQWIGEDVLIEGHVHGTG
jgi:riboflavin biosynthesis pyrimidine reductase